MWLALSLLCSTPAAAKESCADPFASVGSWDLAGATLHLDRGVLSFEGAVLAEQVLDLDVRADRAVFTVRSGPRRDLVAFDGSTLHTLISAQSPAQPTLSPDGRLVAFVDGVTSITSVWMMPFAGGEPRQLTNEGLIRAPGRAPVGFVESPSHGITFQGAWLTWEGETAPHRVRWTGGAR